MTLLLQNKRYLLSDFIEDFVLRNGYLYLPMMMWT